MALCLIASLNVSIPSWASLFRNLRLHHNSDSLLNVSAFRATSNLPRPRNVLTIGRIRSIGYGATVTSDKRPKDKRKVDTSNPLYYVLVYINTVTVSFLFQPERGLIASSTIRRSHLSTKRYAERLPGW